MNKKYWSLISSAMLLCMVLGMVSCKKNHFNNGDITPTPTVTDFFVDVDFLPAEEADGEVAPRMMANINNDVVMIELRPAGDTVMETLLLLGPDNCAIMLCGDDNLMVCAPYDMESYTPSHDVLLVRYLDENTLLLTKCFIDWNTNNMTTHDMMTLPIDDNSKTKRKGGDVDAETREFFFNRFVKPLAAGFEQVEHFCGIFGSPAESVFASLRLIITTELTSILYSDEPEELHENTTHYFKSSVDGLIQTGVLHLLPRGVSEIVSRILASIA